MSRMPKGQLSRVPWPGNSWMPFTFLPARSLGTSAAPKTFTLTPASLATHTELTHHYTYTQYALSTLFIFFFLVLKDFFKVPHQSTKMALNSGCRHRKM